jgi:hypothetical protein
MYQTDGFTSQKTLIFMNSTDSVTGRFKFSVSVPLHVYTEAAKEVGGSTSFTSPL